MATPHISPMMHPLHPIWIASRVHHSTTQPTSQPTARPTSTGEFVMFALFGAMMVVVLSAGFIEAMFRKKR